MLQGGSKNQLILRQGPWKLIIQSNHKLTKFEPTALFNLEENPTEEETRNLIDDPEHQERAQRMYDHYFEVRNGGRRTAPRAS
jgi:hypothetical protein